MQKNFWLILGVIIIALVGLFVVSGGKQSTSVTFEGEPAEIQDFDHVEGEGEVVLMEFGDFACPACGQVYPLIEQLEQDYEGQMKFVFRHFPLSDLHPNALAAHRAAEAAGMQDSFWEMYDLLYQNQSQWTRQGSGLDVSAAARIFENYAEQLGLDMEQFKEDVASEEVFATIDKQISSGQQLGATGTPTFFLNGEEMPGITSYDQLTGLIDEALAETGGDQEAEQSGDQSEAAENPTEDQSSEANQ